MANAAFFVNDIKVKKKGQYILVEARKKCKHGTVFDEVFLTLPAQLMYLFTEVEGPDEKKLADDISTDILAKRFNRFTSEN